MQRVGGAELLGRGAGQRGREQERRRAVAPAQDGRSGARERAADEHPTGRGVQDHRTILPAGQPGRNISNSARRPRSRRGSRSGRSASSRGVDAAVDDVALVDVHADDLADHEMLVGGRPSTSWSSSRWTTLHSSATARRRPAAARRAARAPSPARRASNSLSPRGSVREVAFICSRRSQVGRFQTNSPRVARTSPSPWAGAGEHQHRRAVADRVEEAVGREVELAVRAERRHPADRRARRDERLERVVRQDRGRACRVRRRACAAYTHCGSTKERRHSAGRAGVRVHAVAPPARRSRADAGHRPGRHARQHQPAARRRRGARVRAPAPTGPRIHGRARVLREQAYRVYALRFERLDRGECRDALSRLAGSSTTTGISRSVLRLVVVVGRPLGGHRLPHSGFSSGRRRARGGREAVADDLHLDVGVRLEVQVPGRRLGVAALGGDDQVVVPVAAVDQRRRAARPTCGRWW